ncbi:hypothetical protein [Candidatus Nitrospira salsa]|nr:MAG: hypothetical protein NPIRA01_01460 [Nitrospirales bacterium]
MRKPNRLLNVMIMNLALFTASCDNSDMRTQEESKHLKKEVKENVQDTLESTKQFTENKFDEYSQAIETSMNALQQKHRQLQKQALQDGKEANIELQDALATLEMKREQLQKQIEEQNSNRDTPLEDLQLSIEQALEELEELYEVTIARFSRQ